MRERSEERDPEIPENSGKGRVGGFEKGLKVEEVEMVSWGSEQYEKLIYTTK